MYSNHAFPRKIAAIKASDTSHRDMLPFLIYPMLLK
jgi:hypothetical protein